ncbi:MAG: protein arginine kinase [Oscillospiraceae bacterium]|nr:protein arginine kinase [Oscillospiraceae bacterium]
MKWYSNKGEHSDVVLSTRIRLARNLKDYPFPARLSTVEKEKVNEIMRDIFLAADSGEKLTYTEMKALSTAEAVSLAEKHLISPEFASDPNGRALLLSEDEDVSIMLCEEDHARIQVILPGLALEEAYEKALNFDKALEEKAAIAFDRNLGYLTQCPTNLGTGMRASVMLHLPALAENGVIARLAATVAKLGLTLRGVYGSTSRFVGSLFQLSNQVTLGISEQAAVKNLNAIALQIAEQETQARQALLKDDAFIDRIWRAYGILTSAHMIGCDEFCDLLSLVRLGAAQGIVDIPLETLSRLLIEMQPATINAKQGENLSQRERDVFRAEAVKKALSRKQ